MKIVCLKNYLIDPLQKAFPQIEIRGCIENNYDAEIIIADSDKLIEENLKKLPLLKLAHSAREGVDAVDIDYIKEHEIMLCNAKGLYSVPIAEDIVTKVLMYSTNALGYMKNKQDRIYQPIQKRCCLTNQTIGFIGTGSIAQEAAKRLKPFGCKLLGYKRRTVDSLAYFDQLYYGSEIDCFLAQSDILIVTLDLNPSTYHMINKETIAMMKDKVAIINIARGEVIDEKALIEALRNNKIAYAGLDVFEKEPLQQNSCFWDMRQVYITPHASGICDENHDRLLELVKHNIKNYIDKKTLIDVILI